MQGAFTFVATPLILITTSEVDTELLLHFMNGKPKHIANERINEKEVFGYGDNI